MSTINGVAAEARVLAGRAQALANQCAALASASDEIAAARLVLIAQRLESSVLRPLKAATAHTAKGAPPTAPTAPTDCEAELHALAIDATTLRARAGHAPLLQEAVAALQQLACSADGDDGAQWQSRREEFSALMAAAPQAIVCAHDGPYLVTNVSRIVDRLGVSLKLTPQVALCRCGASLRKPWCDGSHAETGWRDAKAENRVADRLDRYEGIGVTIIDNRGTCAHSGFCTDRLPATFRAHDEPFVAPSGGRADEILRAARDCPSGALGAALSGRDPLGASDSNREAAIEVSLDGPYRVTGAIALSDHQGRPEVRNEGASLEHYSLCRCGQSQNKPFCSGMHWYAEFHDPPPPEQPTLFEWAGGFPALLRLTTRFYAVHVAQDPLLSGLFSRMSPDHPERVAAWLGQVFGGPPAYSDAFGDYDRMISQHLGRALTPEQRARWVRLLAQSAEDVGLPADAEFRAAFTAYVEWGSRIALENSQPGVEPPPHMPVPHWWWVCNAYPWSRAHATREPDEEQAPPELPAPDEQVSFIRHIKPLFRPRDRDSMRFAFDLWSHSDVSASAAAILERLRNGTMPCDGAWSSEHIEVFSRWVATGMPE